MSAQDYSRRSSTTPPDFERLPSSRPPSIGDGVLRQIMWAKELELGLPLVDEQHQALVGTINALSTAIEAEAVADIGRVALTLIDYARVHFAYEDQFLERLGDAGRDEHRAAHANFLRTAMDAYRAIQTGDLVVGVGLFSVLQNWLLTHIRSEDPKYL